MQGKGYDGGKKRVNSDHRGISSECGFTNKLICYPAYENQMWPWPFSGFTKTR